MTKPEQTDYTDSAMIRVPMRTLDEQERRSVLARKRFWLLRSCEGAGVVPSRIIVFGSAGRNELREDSDLDIAILFQSDDDLQRGRAAVRRAEREDQWPLDLLFYTEEEFASRATIGGVCMIIRDEGYVLFRDDSVCGDQG